MTYLVAVEEPWTGTGLDPEHVVKVTDDVEGFSCDVLASLDGQDLGIEQREGDPMEIAQAYIADHELAGKISRIEINLDSGWDEYVPERGRWKKIDF